MLIVGGGRVGYALAELLSQKHMKVKVVETSDKRAKVLAENTPGSKSI